MKNHLQDKKQAFYPLKLLYHAAHMWVQILGGIYGLPISDKVEFLSTTPQMLVSIAF